MLKKLQKIKKKQDNDVDTDVAQYERNNNKCYTLTFKYIQICHVLKFFFPSFNTLVSLEKKKKKKKTLRRQYLVKHKMKHQQQERGILEQR